MSDWVTDSDSDTPLPPHMACTMEIVQEEILRDINEDMSPSIHAPTPSTRKKGKGKKKASGLSPPCDSPPFPLGMMEKFAGESEPK
jgi:hypothetical protein